MKQSHEVQSRCKYLKEGQVQQRASMYSSKNMQNEYILKQQEMSNQFEYQKTQKEIECIVQQIIQQKLKERRRILLAKLARQNIVIQDEVIKSSRLGNSILQMGDSLIGKSLQEINQYYCGQISSKLVKRVVRFLKHRKIAAKIMSTAILIENNKSGFNLGGMCFWNNNADGQKTIRKRIAPIVYTLNDQRKVLEKEGLLIVTIYLCKFEKRFRNS